MLVLTGCFTPAKERQLKDEIFNLQTRVMQLESALMDENTPAGEAAKRRLASTAMDIEKISSETNRIKGELESLKIGVTTGFMPGVEGDQTNSVGGKIRVLSERMATLEATQGDVIASLEKQGVRLKGADKSAGTVAKKTEKTGDQASEKNSETEPATAEDDGKAPDTHRKHDKTLTTLKQFRDAYGKRQFKRVAEDAPDALKATPKTKDREEIAFLYAESLYKMGQMREAALQFNEFIDSKPAVKYLPQARLRMGDAFRNLGDPATAKLYYQELITKHPKSPEANKAKDRLKELGKSSRAGH
jgi:TolA-binding protein